MSEKGLAIVISTGTEEKMVMLGVLTQTAVNLECLLEYLSQAPH